MRQHQAHRPCTAVCPTCSQYPPVISSFVWVRSVSGINSCPNRISIYSWRLKAHAGLPKVYMPCAACCRKAHGRCAWNGAQVFVAGATGNTGRRVVQQLSQQGFTVLAGTRDEKKAQSLGFSQDKNIQTVKFNLFDPECASSKPCRLPSCWPHAEPAAVTSFELHGDATVSRAVMQEHRQRYWRRRCSGVGARLLRLQSQ